MIEHKKKTRFDVNTEDKFKNPRKIMKFAVTKKWCSVPLRTYHKQYGPASKFAYSIQYGSWAHGQCTFNFHASSSKNCIQSGRGAKRRNYSEN